ncbi:MAG TPA: hypothetical protein VFH61_10170 [Thermoleophilia bacterium]|nr:hypothetical protein [Thermoleophilia bacterium]
MGTAVVTTRGREASLTILTSGFTPPGPVTAILMADGHIFQQNTDTVADVAGDEISATGYARRLVSFDPFVEQGDGSVTQRTVALSFGPVGGAVNATVSGCYLFWDSGNDATSTIFACVEFVTAKTTDGTDLRVTPIALNWSPTSF